jgi:hypothetical protein
VNPLRHKGFMRRGLWSIGGGREKWTQGYLARAWPTATLRRWAKLADWSLEELAAEFAGINSPTESAVTYFGRVLKGQPDWDCTIPFRRLIEKYKRMVEILVHDGRLRACPCGCGAPIFRRVAEHPEVYASGAWSGADPLVKYPRPSQRARHTAAQSPEKGEGGTGTPDLPLEATQGGLRP